MKWMMAAVLAVMVLATALVLPVAAAQPADPTQRAELGSFNKSPSGLEHQSDAAWLHDGPADPHVEWD